MLINYTSPAMGKYLYHLVFIGEEGAGNIKFAIKTKFEEKSLTLVRPVGKVYAGNVTTLTFVSKNFDLKEARLHYTISNWQNSSELAMVITENGMCTATISGQEAGTLVQYRVEALDMLEDEIVATGNYTVKYAAYDTYIKKPMFPVRISESQVPIGANWTILCHLTANHKYHIYFYGDWVDTEPNVKTDYDIYVYSPFGELEGYHTQSAELQEHLGINVTSIREAFFTPKHTGNYTFTIRNDPRESQGAQAATFMIIENRECNVWNEVFIQGKENDKHVENTSWAFEFVTLNSLVEVWVKVPDTLDMYEVRLYLMANPEAGIGEMVNNVPLAWETAKSH